MPLMIEVSLPWPPRGLSPNGRLTTFPKAKLIKKARQEAFYLTKQATKCRKIEAQALRVTLICRPPSTRPDDDNIIACCKPARDGIAEALGVNDRAFRMQPVVWETAGRPGRVLVRIEAVE